MHTVISGAGVAGPALAWFLARSGTRVTLVEKAASLLPHGQNVDIQNTARIIIQKMGLQEEFLRRGTKEKGTQFVDTQGKTFAPLPLTKESAISATSEYEILRGDLADLLYQATKDHPNVDYRFGTTIKKVLSNDEKSVKVELSTGEVQEYDLLVLSDGQWSKLRTQIFPEDAVNVVDLGMYVGYWTVPRISTDDGWWNVYMGTGSRTITIRPDPHGTSRAMYSRMPRTEEQKKEWQDAIRAPRHVQEALLKRDFYDAGWQSKRLLDAMPQAEDFYFQAMQQIRMSTWSSNRVVCLGDTAHAPTALTGMGTSLAINGAYSLAGELSKLEQGEHPERALQAYERVFKPFVDKVQQVPWFVPGVGHYEKAWTRAIFWILVSIISRIVRMPIVSKSSKANPMNEPDFPITEYPGLKLDGKNESPDKKVSTY